MTVNRTTLLDLPIITTGTESGVWGNITNNGLSQYMDIAIAGMTSLTSANFTAGALTIANTQGDSSATNIAAGSAQYATIKVSSLAANSTITAPSSNRAYRIINADGTYTLTIKASGQTGVTFPINTSGIVVFNGTDYVLLGSYVIASAGTASLPSITTTGDTNTGIYFPAADTIAFTEGGAESMRIDSSGNLGLGVTPSAWSGKALEVGSKGTAIWNINQQNSSFTCNAYYDGAYKYGGTGSATSYQQAAGVHYWYTAPSGTAGNTITFTQAMTLDASGNLLVGTTTTGFTNSRSFTFQGVGDGKVYVNHSTLNGSGDGYIGFGYNGSQIGSITQNGTTAVAYNTSSDYRLKEDIAPMTGALAKVAALKPVTYKWKSDGSDGEGFIAHELQAVVPHAVTGEKDAVDAEGKPQYQGIDTSFLVATLTAAIQEQQALITSLTARVAALEGTQP